MAEARSSSISRPASLPQEYRPTTGLSDAAWPAVVGNHRKALVKGRRPVCTGHGSAAARRAGAVHGAARPSPMSVDGPEPTSSAGLGRREGPRGPRRRVAAIGRAQQGPKGSSGPHRTSRCAAAPSGTVLWRRSVWASSRCVSSASPSRPRTGSPANWTTSSTICTGGWTTSKPRMIGPRPTSSGRSRNSLADVMAAAVLSRAARAARRPRHRRSVHRRAWVRRPNLIRRSSPAWRGRRGRSPS